MPTVPLTRLSGSQAPIGSDQFKQDSGTDITDANGYWLRSGLYATAASYPEAAALEHCKVTGLTATNSESILHLQSADNGAGVVVVTASGLTAGNVLVSTDDGATWTSIATGITGSATGVVRNGTRFIIASNDASNFYTRWSTDGVTWNAGGTLALSGVTTTTVRLAYNGTVVYGQGNGSVVANQSAFTTTDGVTLTGRTAPDTDGLQDLKAGGGTFVLMIASTDFYTSTDGISWATRTPPDPVRYAAFLGGDWVLKNISTAIYYTTTNFTTFTSGAIPLALGLTASSSLSNDATRVYAGIVAGSSGYQAIAWTDDLIKWRLRWLTSSLGGNTGWYCHGGKYFFPKGSIASSTVLYTSDFSTADFVGSSCLSSIGTVSTTTNTFAAMYRKLAD